MVSATGFAAAALLGSATGMAVAATGGFADEGETASQSTSSGISSSSVSSSSSYCCSSSSSSSSSRSSWTPAWSAVFPKVHAAEYGSIPSKTKVFSWGRNFHGELGTGDGDGRLTPSGVTGLAEGDVIVQLDAAGHWSAVVTATGELLTFGQGRDGQLALGMDENESIPKLVVDGLPSEDCVAAVACGVTHLAVVTKDGALYTCGYGGAGALGLGDTNNTHTLKPVSGLPKVIAVAAGASQTIVLTEGGDVYHMGDQKLGLGRPGHTSDTIHRTPVKVEALSGKNIVQIDAGDGHLLARGEDGTVYAWGAGDTGQLGDGRRWEAYQTTPRRIRALAGQKVKHIAAGAFHSFAVAEDGRVWSWGRGREGQLGHGSDADQPIPTVVQALEGRPVITVVGGGYHSIALVDEPKEVLVFGKGRDGQLGRGDVIGREEPTKLDGVDGSKVVAIAGGEGHTLVVLADE